MAQAFDDKGNPLGNEIIKPSADEAFQAVLSEHMDAAEYRVRRLKESLEPSAEEIIKKIDSKLGDGWCKKLYECFD